MKSAFYNQLSQSDAHRASRDANCEAAIQSNEVLSELFALSFSLEDKNHFKACWALELVLEKNLNLILPYLDIFCSKTAQYRNDSAIRSVAKICLFLSESKTISLTDAQKQQLIEACLDWLIGTGKVAAKAYAMRALYAFGKKQPWINEELKTILAQDYAQHSAAYKSAAKDLLKRLK